MVWPHNLGLPLYDQRRHVCYPWGFGPPLAMRRLSLTSFPRLPHKARRNLEERGSMSVLLGYGIWDSKVKIAFWSLGNAAEYLLFLASFGLSAPLVDELCSFRLLIGPHYDRQAKVKGFLWITSAYNHAYFKMWRHWVKPWTRVRCLNFLWGDYISFDSPETTNNFSVNVQSIMNKIDLLETELCNFSITCLAETWLNDSIYDAEIEFEGLTTFVVVIVIRGYVYMLIKIIIPKDEQF